MYSNELVCQILDFIDENINRKVTIQEISSKFYYNRYYIMKLFKRELGVSILDYINKIRIYNSMFLIKSSSYSLTKVALMNGFCSLEYFSETFNNFIGVSPSIFKSYCKYNFTKKEDDFIKIIDSWTNLQVLVDFVKKYKKNKKPKGIPVLRRSIFN